MRVLLKAKALLAAAAAAALHGGVKAVRMYGEMETEQPVVLAGVRRQRSMKSELRGDARAKGHGAAATSGADDVEDVDDGGDDVSLALVY